MTEGLDVKSTTRHGNPEIFKAVCLSNVAAWQECLARRVSHNHFLQLERLEKPDGEISVSCVGHPQVFFTTGKKFFICHCPFICTTTLLVTGCCIYGIGTPKLPVLPSDPPASSVFTGFQSSSVQDTPPSAEGPCCGARQCFINAARRHPKMNYPNK